MKTLKYEELIGKKMVINFRCNACGKRFSIVSPIIPYRGALSCFFCKSPDVKRICHKDLVKEMAE